MALARGVVTAIDLGTAAIIRPQAASADRTRCGVRHTLANSSDTDRIGTCFTLALGVPAAVIISAAIIRIVPADTDGTHGGEGRRRTLTEVSDTDLIRTRGAGIRTGYVVTAIVRLVSAFRIGAGPSGRLIDTNAIIGTVTGIIRTRTGKRTIHEVPAIIGGGPAGNTAAGDCHRIGHTVAGVSNTHFRRAARRRTAVDRLKAIVQGDPAFNAGTGSGSGFGNAVAKIVIRFAGFVGLAEVWTNNGLTAIIECVAANKRAAEIGGRIRDTIIARIRTRNT